MLEIDTYFKVFISVSTAERSQEKSWWTIGHVMLHLPQENHSMSKSVSDRNKTTNLAKYIHCISRYIFTKPVVFIIYA